MNKLVSLFFLSTMQFGSAHAWSCLIEDKIRLTPEVQSLSDCFSKRPLRLVSGSFYFPKLRGGWYDVRYWDGVFARTQVIRIPTRTIITNICTNKTVLDETTWENFKKDIEFNVENPNLSPEISESFRLAPMTDEEANEQFLIAQNRCESMELK